MLSCKWPVTYIHVVICDLWPSHWPLPPAGAHDSGWQQVWPRGREGGWVWAGLQSGHVVELGLQGDLCQVQDQR